MIDALFQALLSDQAPADLALAPGFAVKRNQSSSYEMHHRYGGSLLVGLDTPE